MHQPHSLYFSRYPYVREATLGFPLPDVIFRNDSDAIVYIHTEHTGGSITVTLYGNNGGRACTSERSGNTVTRVMEHANGAVTTQSWSWSYRAKKPKTPRPRRPSLRNPQRRRLRLTRPRRRRLRLKRPRRPPTAPIRERELIRALVGVGLMMIPRQPSRQYPLPQGFSADAAGPDHSDPARSASFRSRVRPAPSRRALR